MENASRVPSVFGTNILRRKSFYARYRPTVDRLKFSLVTGGLVR